uniref:Uncharacterized protein n=1 Tax=Arcella intermedia TaxID=1963864 RepID=A0A6B2LBP8_9EUKA
MERKRFAEAYDCFQQAVLKNPRNPAIWNNKGIALHHLGRYEESLYCFNEAIRLEPKNPSAYHNKGYLLKEINQCEESIQSFDEALKLDPDNPNAWLSKGVCFRYLKNIPEARKCYETARELNEKKQTDSDELPLFDLKKVPHLSPTKQDYPSYIPKGSPIELETKPYHPNSNPYKYAHSVPSHPLASPNFPDPNSYHPDKATTTAANIYFQRKEYPNTYGEDFPGSEALKKKVKPEKPTHYIPRLWTPQQILDAMGPDGPPVKVEPVYYPDNYPNFEKDFKFTKDK